MDVSNQEKFDSQELIQTLASLSGIPEPLVCEEIDQILEVTGLSAAPLTLEDLRKAMLAYLQALHDAGPGFPPEQEENAPSSVLRTLPT